MQATNHHLYSFFVGPRSSAGRWTRCGGLCPLASGDRLRLRALAPGPPQGVDQPAPDLGADADRLRRRGGGERESAHKRGVLAGAGARVELQTRTPALTMVPLVPLPRLPCTRRRRRAPMPARAGSAASRGQLGRDCACRGGVSRCADAVTGRGGVQGRGRGCVPARSLRTLSRPRGERRPASPALAQPGLAQVDR